jgi:hypothetical protein
VFQRLGAVNSPLCRLYAGGGHDLPLPAPVRNAILGRENAGIWRMSVYSDLLRQNENRGKEAQSNDNAGVHRASITGASERHVLPGDPLDGIGARSACVEFSRIHKTTRLFA